MTRGQLVEHDPSVIARIMLLAQQPNGNMDKLDMVDAIIGLMDLERNRITRRVVADNNRADKG